MPTIPARYRSAAYIAALIAAVVLVGLELAGVADAETLVAQVTDVTARVLVVVGLVLAVVNRPTEEG
jgi:uncharacterized membrane protein